MFTNHQSPIALIRRELRGQLPDSWLDDVLYVAEYGGESLDELSMEDLLKLKVAAVYSGTLKQLLDQASRQHRDGDEISVRSPSSTIFGMRF